MRSRLFIAAVLLYGVPARATDAPASKDKAGGEAAAAATPQAGSSTTASTGDTASAGLWLGRSNPNKRWEVGAAYELHGLIRQNDLNGAGSNKLLNFFYLFGHVDVTPRNRLSIRGGVYQRLIADGGETGFRMSDIVATYSRLVPLPWKLALRVKGSLTAPTSFESHKATLITAPTVGLQLDRRFGRFSVDAQLFGTVYIYEATTPTGGANPNPKGSLGGLVEAEYDIPYLRGLTLGLDLFDEYVWYYDVANGGTANSQFTGTVADSTFASQPAQQVYGGEVFLRYSFPALVGIHTDLMVAYAQGDPTLGYTSVLHDGVAHVYPFWRQTSEVYGVVSARY
jgi:hypothetical protein